MSARSEGLFQAEDRVSAYGALLVGIGAVAMIAIGILWALGLLHQEAGPRPTRIASPAGSSLLHVPFPGPEGPRGGPPPRDPLATWSWVDRGRGIVAMPIERAIDVWLAQGREPVAPPAGAPAPTGARR